MSHPGVVPVCRGVTEGLSYSQYFTSHIHHHSKCANCKDVKGNFVPVLLPSKIDYSTIHDLLPHHTPYRPRAERREVSSSKATSLNNPDLGVGASFHRKHHPAQFEPHALIERRRSERN